MSAPRLVPAAGVLAVLLGLLLAMTDRGDSVPSDRPAPAPAWARAVEDGADHVTAPDLVARLGADPRGVLLVDLRPAAEFAAFHLKDSVNLSLPRLLGPEGEAVLDARAGATVVLVSNGMTHPAQAWVELARAGRRDVRVLEDGIEGLRTGVLAPPSLRGPTTERAAIDARAGWAEATRLLLGRRIATPTPVAARLATDPPRLESPTVVSAAWVARRGKDVVVLDTREDPAAFAKGHVPGALHLPIAATRETRGDVADELLPPARLAEAFGRLGIDEGTEVVAYAGERLQDPTHAVLALVALGHRRAAVMEGGLAAWKAEGLPLAAGASMGSTPRTYAVHPGADAFRTELERVVAASRGEGPPILDVRPGDAFRGETTGGEARAGHIPASLHRDHRDDTVVVDGGVWWRPLDELRASYAALGLRPDAPVIVTCRTGHQASQTWFTLRWLLGYRDVRWYDGSWKEWAARADLPAVTSPSGNRPPP
ncbi:MAG TPA: rhodanese-like domain-containing protein [Planctomycetota bacterium]|nr:rhodanese-like domain-containing protein [Planctomycetota bacterium]